MPEHHLRFNLAAVIALADQTASGPAHRGGRGDDPHTLALLLVTGTHGGALVVLAPHRPDGPPLIDQLRSAAAHGHHILTVALTDAGVSIGTGRRRRRTPPPARGTNPTGPGAPGRGDTDATPGARARFPSSRPRRQAPHPGGGNHEGGQNR